MEELNKLGEERAIWWHRLNTRYERLERLIELDAPLCIIKDEVKMVKKAEKMCEMLTYQE